MYHVYKLARSALEVFHTVMESVALDGMLGLPGCMNWHACLGNNIRQRSVRHKMLLVQRLIRDDNR